MHKISLATRIQVELSMAFRMVRVKRIVLPVVLKNFKISLINHGLSFDQIGLLVGLVLRGERDY